MAQDTQLALFESQLAAIADANVKAETASPGVKFISTKSGMLAMGGQPIQGNNLDVVIIAAPQDNTYYPGAYNPNNKTGPACFAVHRTETGAKPSPTVENPQGTDCTTCPKAQWGSKSPDSKAKACKMTKRLLMISPTDLGSIEQVALAEIAAVRPPVTSLKYYAAYLQEIAGKLRKPLAAVVTNISIEPDQKTQYKLVYKFVRAIDDMAIIKALVERGEVEVAKAIATAGADEEEDVAPTGTDAF